MVRITKYHPTEALLAAYAAGNLPEALSVVVATHLSFCDECRANVAAHEAIGGFLLDSTDPIELSSGSLEAAIEKIKAKTQMDHPLGEVPLPLSRYVGHRYGDLKWRGIGGGVSQILLDTKGSESVRMLRIPGGMELPDHGHRGLELTLVLKGAFYDGDDRFGPGDIEVADDEVEHTPIAEEGQDCICLAAQEGQLKFKSLLPRIAQIFT